MANFFQITRTEFTVAQYIGWMRSGELELNPNFQRRSVWKAPAKSYFIDTVARGLPVPIIFLRERTDLSSLRTIREVVDGQQRLRTLFSYISPELLPNFHEERDSFTVSKIHNDEIGGKKFSELSFSVREHMISYQISTHVLPSSTSDAEVLDMFRRMNASGVKLTAQELRNAQFFGAFSQVAKDLSNQYLDAWRSWRVFSESDFARMREVEFVSELMILIQRGIQEKTQRSIDNAYKISEDTYPSGDFIILAFNDTMEHIERWIGPRLWATPFSNSAVFYALFAALLDLRFGPVHAGKRGQELQELPDGIAERLPSLAQSLAQRDRLPLEVREALISRSNRLTNRKAIRDFIFPRLVKDDATN